MSQFLNPLDSLLSIFQPFKLHQDAPQFREAVKKASEIVPLIKAPSPLLETLGKHITALQQSLVPEVQAKSPPRNAFTAKIAEITATILKIKGLTKTLVPSDARALTNDFLDEISKQNYEKAFSVLSPLTSPITKTILLLNLHRILEDNTKVKEENSKLKAGVHAEVIKCLEMQFEDENPNLRLSKVNSASLKLDSAVSGSYLMNDSVADQLYQKSRKIYKSYIQLLLEQNPSYSKVLASKEERVRLNKTEAIAKIFSFYKNNSGPFTDPVESSLKMVDTLADERVKEYCRIFIFKSGLKHSSETVGHLFPAVCEEVKKLSEKEKGSFPDSISRICKAYFQFDHFTVDKSYSLEEFEKYRLSIEDRFKASSLPVMIASFSTDPHQQVDKLIKKALEVINTSPGEKFKEMMLNFLKLDVFLCLEEAAERLFDKTVSAEVNTKENAQAVSKK